MKQYVEVYPTPGYQVGSENKEIIVTPENGFVAKVYIIEGQSLSKAREKASVAAYTLRIDDKGKLTLQQA